jgi:hypothetical protein
MKLDMEDRSIPTELSHIVSHRLKKLCSLVMTLRVATPNGQLAKDYARFCLGEIEDDPTEWRSDQLAKDYARFCLGDPTTGDKVDNNIVNKIDNKWRVGDHYKIHVYRGDVPIATFLRSEDAEAAVSAVNTLNSLEKSEYTLKDIKRMEEEIQRWTDRIKFLEEQQDRIRKIIK